MFLNYEDFCVFESKNVKYLEKAKHLISKNKELSKVLDECVDGVYSKIQVVLTQGAKSYVAVATNSGYPDSSLFITPDPKKALLAMIIKNTGQEDPDELIGMIKVRDVLVEYSVFAGNRKLTHSEMKAKYNLMYSDFASYLPILVGTPIVKKF